MCCSETLTVRSIAACNRLLRCGHGRRLPRAASSPDWYAHSDRPPFLAVEVLSGEDRLTRMQPKIQEYLRIGVEHVWLVDPEERSALSYTPPMPAARSWTCSGP